MTASCSWCSAIAVFQEMFGLPDELVQRGALFRDTIHFLASRGEYGHDESVEDMVNLRVEQALAFEPHYMERVRPNGQVVSIEGAPLPQGGWVAVYTDITGMRRAENLLRARSEELSEQLLGHAEELSATNRKLAATIAALEEAKRELTEIEARTRLVTEMMPAHIAHLDSDGLYDYSNRRLSAVMPGRPSDILGLHISEALGAVAFARVESHLQKAYDGEQSVFEVHRRSGFSPHPCFIHTGWGRGCLCHVCGHYRRNTSAGCLATDTSQSDGGANDKWPCA